MKVSVAFGQPLPASPQKVKRNGSGLFGGLVSEVIASIIHFDLHEAVTYTVKKGLEPYFDNKVLFKNTRPIVFQLFLIQ